MLDSMQIAVLSTLACFVLLFLGYVKSVIGKAAKLEKEARSKQTTANDEDTSNKAGSKPRKVRLQSSTSFNVCL